MIEKQLKTITIKDDPDKEQKKRYIKLFLMQNINLHG